MNGSDREAGDDRTFRVAFTGEGAARLRERVKEKLKEFMGDYTDDTLAEYVVVLLRNGRRKEEAGKELNVFLGDDSVSFVSWLWDHLSSNLHLYVQPRESFQAEGAKTKSILGEQSKRDSLQPEHPSGNVQLDSEYEREKSDKASRSRRNRDWKGLVVQDETRPLLRSYLIENSDSEKKTLLKRSPTRQSRSPGPRIHKKRSRLDESQPAKREMASHPMLDAPRRLLQFAVRDAVRTVQQSALRSEPALKRLRSVVSTSTVDSTLDELPLKSKSVARVPGAVATAIKAAAEAAEDAIKVRCSANVFDRLGNGMDRAEINNQPSDSRAPVLEDGEYEDFDQIQGPKDVDYYQRSDHDGEFEGEVTMLDRDTGMASDFVSDNDGYDNIGISRHRVMDAPHSTSSALKDKDSVMVQYSVAQNADAVSRKTRTNDQDPPISAAANTSRKILNISVNVNTWKPQHYQAPREVTEVESRLGVEKSEAGPGKLGVRVPKENNTSLPENQNEAVGSGAQKETQKPVASTPVSYSTGRPSEDADSRIVFVNNVHYAATKDTLSRHFNKFGEVLKVIIVTDAATGQPKGSAYVEFLRKESAELALSLNGTSFMSRILKVVQRSSAHHEAAPVMAWPRIARASPFASRLGRVPYSRAIMPSAFRARLPIKLGARSLQWKRGVPASPTTGGTKNLPNAPMSGNNILSQSGPRNLTYVRTESKSDANSGPV